MKNKLLSFIAAAILSAEILLSPAVLSVPVQAAYNGNAAVTAANTSASSVSAPTADKKSGLQICDGSYLKVNLSCKTKNAVIYYKINNGSYKKYTKTIGITKNSTLSAYALLNGKKSKVVTYDYELGANFSLSVYSGDYTENQTVKATTNVPGVTLRYTLNGKIPTEKASEFPSNGLKIENTASLYVMAFKDGWSEVGYNETYNINKLGNYKTNYYYNLLSGSEKEAYKRIVTAVEIGDEKTSLADLKLTNDSLLKIVEYINNDTSDKIIYNRSSWYAYSYTDNHCIDVFFNYDETLDKKNKELEEKAAKIIAAAQKQPTAYGKLKYIHDWIVSNTDYYDKANASLDVGNAYGVIVEGKGGCGGYARAFQYLAQGLGFDCIIISGTVPDNDIGHAWSMVKLDGTWYYVDVTWDDPVNSKDNKIYYDYFLKSEKTMNKNHTPRKDYEYPSAPKDYSVQ